MSDLMKEVQDAAVNFQQCYAKVLSLTDDSDRLQKELSTCNTSLQEAVRDMEQARTRMYRASLALGPSTSMEN